MNPVKSTLLAFFMISGIALWGAGIYTADAAGDFVSADGYGVSATSD